MVYSCTYYVIFYTISYHIHRAMHGPRLRSRHEPKTLEIQLCAPEVHILMGGGERERLTGRDPKRDNETKRVARVHYKQVHLGKGIHTQTAWSAQGSEGGSCGTMG